MPAETHSHRGPVEAAEVERLVRERLAEILDVDPEQVTPGNDLRADLHADDYALLQLAEAVEDELGERTVGIRIDDDLAELVTVADVVDCVVALLEREGSSR